MIFLILHTAKLFPRFYSDDLLDRTSENTGGYCFLCEKRLPTLRSERRRLFRPKTPVRFGRVAAPRPSGRGRVVLLADKVGFGSNLSPSGIPGAPVPLARSLVCESSWDAVPVAGTT